MKRKLDEALAAFAAQQGIAGKGALSVVLTVTRIAQGMAFPLRHEDFLAPKAGQVAGLGGGAVKKILKEHGITQALSSEGGRTSRGSIDTMRTYVDCLNRLSKAGGLDLKGAEVFWIGRVREHFSAAPFKLKLDKSLSIRALVRELMSQAKKRQAQRPGSTIAGTVLQHLVAAKMRCLMGPKAFVPHKASSADSSRSTGGDFEIGDSVIHVTLAPTDALLGKCAANIASGKSPIIVTSNESITHALALAETLGIADRLEVWGFEQFVSTNIHEWSRFSSVKAAAEVRRLIGAYNEIIAEIEEEPSLRIDL